MNGKKWFKLSLVILVCVLIGCACYLYHSLFYMNQQINEYIDPQLMERVQQEEVQESETPADAGLVEESVDHQVVSQDNDGYMVETPEEENYVLADNGELYTVDEYGQMVIDHFDTDGNGEFSEEEIEALEEDTNKGYADPSRYQVYCNIITNELQNDSYPVPYHLDMTAFDVLETMCTEQGIDLQYNSIGSVYVTSIAGLAERDYGGTSGWTYTVNGEYPSVSADQYILSDGDVVEWIYKYE